MRCLLSVYSSAVARHSSMQGVLQTRQSPLNMYHSPRCIGHSAPARRPTASVGGHDSSSSSSPRGRWGGHAGSAASAACAEGSKQRFRRSIAVSAAASGQPAAQPDLSKIRKQGDLERLLFAQMMQGNRNNASEVPQKPDNPVTPADFVQALEMVVRSSSQRVNPTQLDDIFEEIVSKQVLEAFSPAQLAVTTKNLAIMCTSLQQDFLESLLQQLQHRMADFSAAQLANISWGLMRLVPLTQADIREELGIDQQWLDSYMAATEQQLQQVISDHTSLKQQRREQQQQQQQQPPPVQPVPRLPNALQIANLLLLPAAALQPLQPSLLQVLEEVLLLRQHSLCGFAVAQLLTCCVRLKQQPGPALLQSLLDHLQEELMVYDYDELTQVVFNAYVMQLQLSDTLLADITRRADALEAEGRAAPQDKLILREALQRFAAQKAAAAAAATAGLTT